MSMAGPGYILIPDKDFADEAVHAEFLKGLLTEMGEAGATMYRDGVPVDTADLRDSVFYDVAELAIGWCLRIGATDWKAALIEAGGSLRAPDGSLRRAVEALGVEFHEERGT